MRTSKRFKQKHHRHYQQKKKQSLPQAVVPLATAVDVSETTPLEKKPTTEKIVPEQQVIEKKAESKPQADTPAIPLRNQQNVRFVLISLLLTTIGSLWLMQNSINAYYQQTYHRNSPLVYLEKNRIWTGGAEVAKQFNQWLNQLQTQIAETNNQFMQSFNQNYAYTPEYKIYLQREQQKRLAKAAQTAAAKQQAKQNQQANDFTLNTTDEVFFAGDSLMQGVAPHVRKWLSEQYGIKSVDLSKQSTGLAYPSFFDWPKTISDTLASNKNIKILVVYLGPNDPWDMPNPKGGGVYLKFQSPQWADVYRQRISYIIQTAKTHHVTVLWLMPPSVRRSKLNQQLIYLRQLMADEVTKNHGYIMDTGNILGCEGTKYSDTLLGNNGQRIKTRSADGIHFSLEGQKIIANSILKHFNIKS